LSLVVSLRRNPHYHDKDLIIPTGRLGLGTDAFGLGGVAGLDGPLEDAFDENGDP
jgi:hypothetical protein